MLSINPKDISTVKLHSYLLSAVAPRPIALASTVDIDGNPNLSPFSFFNVFSANPPILIFSPARRVRGNTTKHTLENVKATKEVVINMVNYDIVQQMSLSSTEYPEGVNEFKKAGFTMLSSEKVTPFRVAESPIQLECKVTKVVELGKEGGAGNLIICEVVKLHIKEEFLDEEGAIDQQKLDLVARAGGSLYSRAKDGFFEIPKPLTILGVGVDAIPSEIRKSPILTGNDLGMLGNIEAIPSESDVNKFAKEHKQNIGDNTLKKHTFAKAFLEKNDVESAWKVLLMN
ncbi:MAG: flavin reductase family protein [Lutibacter sp.]|uniref:flavin reductase family protein n=1 Tax=Lutibacter sp. TaxID=1925666 RepID=UPI00385A79B3